MFGVRFALDRLAHRVVSRLEYRALVLEFYFNLLRVNVHVNRILRNFKRQDRKRKARLRNQRFVRLVDCLGYRPTLDDSPVDYERLPTAIALEDVRFGDVAAQFQIGGVQA